MFNLLKKLLSSREGPHTVVLIDDNGSKPSTSHRISPVNLWLVLLGAVAGISGLVVVLLVFTPLGGGIYNQQQMRDSVIAIQRRVEALQDTLTARNAQLKQIKSVMAAGEDTAFAFTPDPVSESADREAVTSRPVDTLAVAKSINMIPEDAVYISTLLQGAPDFPAPYPVDGSLTRLFNSAIGHYGLDIATREGAPFRAIADGVVLSKEWTLNYGFVVVVQHNNGFVTIYKHASGVQKEIGESVTEGDILGTVGDIGILSSGPHLHMEIWKQGVPQNPQNYLLKS